MSTTAIARLTIADLPPVRGRMIENADLSALTWLRVGGPADVLFMPADEADLGDFLTRLDGDVPVYPMGVGSNLLVRDGGIRGVVVRLAKGFADIHTDGVTVHAGAAALDAHLAKKAGAAGIGGLEFYCGVPGTIGGALAMNAGAYGRETRDVMIEATGFDRQGTPFAFTCAEMDFAYRHCGVAAGRFFTGAIFRGMKDDPAAIEARMATIMRQREESQPIRERTGGSTFANPLGQKSWALIDSVGGRGRRVGDAEFSEQHCNFLINRGNAAAADLEALGEGVRADVLTQHEIDLRWEIRRVGEPGALGGKS
ncbi:MAG: UDP-N-acetylmuramate dehydrogenase [Pseudomonadota bacterium]